MDQVERAGGAPDATDWPAVQPGAVVGLQPHSDRGEVHAEGRPARARGAGRARNVASSVHNNNNKENGLLDD